MKRMVHALFSLAVSSVFCVFFGLSIEIAFLSAVFSVALTVFRGKWVNSLLIWAVVFQILITVALFGVFVEMSASASLGYSFYMLMEWLEGNVALVPDKHMERSINVPEKLIAVSSASVFLIFLLLFL